MPHPLRPVLTRVLLGAAFGLALAAQLGGSSANAQKMPVDPINKLMACGRCSATQYPCQTNAECDKTNKEDTCQGGAYLTKNGVTNWVPNPKIDPITCWNSEDRQFICPKLDADNPDSVSRLYQYTAVAGGLQYQIGAEFEVPPPAGGAGSNWWSPPLPTGVSQCITPATLGKVCTSDADCLICSGPNCKVCSITNVQCARSADCRLPNEACVPAVPVAGSCKSTGAVFSYTGICRNAVLSSNAGVCGDGVVNSNETCELGETKTAPCSATARHPDGTEFTVSGHQLQTCIACSGWAPDPRAPQCQPDAVCGNGKIDGVCSNNAALACKTSADCGGSPCNLEICDDGVLNGSYGHCARDCKGYGAYCGDAQLSPGEVCDNGSAGPNANGTYSVNFNPDGCSADCRTSAPYCGNGKVDTGFEECEIGDTQRTQKTVCKYSNGTTGIPCDTATDCPAIPGASVTCGGDPSTNSCVGVTVLVNGAARATQHVRECSDQCDFKGKNWSGCVPIGICGDGVLDAGEQCDDGQGNGPTRRCTDVCKKNVCGDGKPFTNVEECDNGPDNGKPTCSAPYGSSCLSCSNQCKFAATAGGYCGDGVKNGPEQCDRTDGVYDPTQPCPGGSADPTCAADATGKYFKRIACTDLGFDYGTVGCSKSTCRFEGCLMCADKVGEGVIRGQVFDSVYDDQPVPKARITLLSKGVKIDQTLADINGFFSFSKLNDDPKCASYKIVVDSYDNNPCTDARDAGQPAGGTCSNAPKDCLKDTDCGAGTCQPKKCNGSAWPTGRLTIDESQNNGYWPFTSQGFSGTQTSFQSGLRNGEAKIYITPRSNPFETTVVVRWNGDISAHKIDAHLYIPRGMAFTSGTVKACSYSNKPCAGNPGVCLGYGDACIDVKTYSQCYGTAGENCMRDVHYAFPGTEDLTKRPYARLFCDDPANCAFPKAPQAMKFSRKYGTIGTFSFYLDDVTQWYKTALVAGRSYASIGLSVEASTDANFITFEPTAGQCAKAWRVFDEDVASGAISAPAQPWQGTHKLPKDLLIGTPECKTPGIYCDNPGYPTPGQYPDQEYKICDDPEVRGDADADGVWDGIDACSGLECAPGDTKCITADACPANDTLCKANTCPASWPYCKPDPDKTYLGCPHPDPDGDNVWGDGINGPDVCPKLPWWDKCEAANPKDPVACQDKNNPGCPNIDRDGDGIRNDKDACPDTPGTPSSDPKHNGCPITLDPVSLVGKRVDCNTFNVPEKPRANTCCREQGSTYPYNDGGGPSPNRCTGGLDSCAYSIANIDNWRGHSRGYDVCASMSSWDFYGDLPIRLPGGATVKRPLQYAAAAQGFNWTGVQDIGWTDGYTTRNAWHNTEWTNNVNTIRPYHNVQGSDQWYTYNCDNPPVADGTKYVSFEPTQATAQAACAAPAQTAGQIGDSTGGGGAGCGPGGGGCDAGWLTFIQNFCGGDPGCYPVYISSWIGHYGYLEGWPAYGDNDNARIGALDWVQFQYRNECHYAREVIAQSDADNCVDTTNDRTHIICKACQSVTPSKTTFTEHDKILDWCAAPENNGKCFDDWRTATDFYCGPGGCGAIYSYNWHGSEGGPVKHLYRPEVCAWLRQEERNAFNYAEILWSTSGGGFNKINTAEGITDDQICHQT